MGFRKKKLFLEKKNRDPWRQAGLTNEMKNLSKQIAQLLQKLCVTLLDISKFVFSWGGNFILGYLQISSPNTTREDQK